MKILILGYSNLAKRKVIPALKNIKGLKFDIASVSHSSVKNGHKVWFRNYTEALKESSANIVYVSLINSLHYQYIKKSISLGKHVIADKPLSLKHYEVDELIHRAKKAKILLAEALTFNYHKQFKELKDIIKKNNSVKNIIMEFNIPKPKKNDAKLSYRLGGGCFNDMIPYAAEINRIFLRKYINIKSFIHKKKNRLSHSFSINTTNKKLEFYGFFSHNSEYENLITFKSENYSIKLDRFCAPPTDNDLIIKFKKKNIMKIIKVKKDDPFQNFIKEFLDKLNDKQYNYYHKRILFNSNFKKKLMKNYK